MAPFLASPTVVCYTGGLSWLPSGEPVEKKGEFKVAFQGYSAELVDLGLDNVTEVISSTDSEMPDVWTYVDGTYVEWESSHWHNSARRRSAMP
jgi:hypothetical protein